MNGWSTFETVLCSGGFLLVGTLLGAWVMHRFGLASDKERRKRDEEDRKRRRDEELHAALTFALKELEAAKKKPPFVDPKDNHIWSPLPEAGFDRLQGKDLINGLDSPLLDSLIEAHGKIREINFHISAQLLNRDSSTPKGDAQNAMLRLREGHEKGIDECILKIKKKLAEMGRTELKPK